jgi:hypothetical protein
MVFRREREKGKGKREEGSGKWERGKKEERREG